MNFIIVLILKILLICGIIIGFLIALKKDMKKLKKEQQIHPLHIMLELSFIIGSLLYVIGLLLFDFLLLGKIALGIITVGLIYNFIINWSVITLFKTIFVMCGFTAHLYLYILFYH